MSLLSALDKEIGIFKVSGDATFTSLISETDSFVAELKSFEAELEQQLHNEEHETISESTVKVRPLEKLTNEWYKNSISSIKTYNTSINKFSKNILNNPKFLIDLDDAYTYPLNLNNFEIPVKGEINSMATITTATSNYHELNKAVVLHLLKTCQSEIVEDLIAKIPANNDDAAFIDQRTLASFQELKRIVDDILINHKLKDAIDWLASKASLTDSNEYSKNLELEFKFHILQYALILNGNGTSSNSFDQYKFESAFEAYMYTLEHFSKFYSKYTNEFDKMILLLCFVNPNASAGSKEEPQLEDLFNMMKGSIGVGSNERRGTGRLSPPLPSSASSGLKTNRSDQISSFVEEILVSFQTIHKNQPLFTFLAYEFISEYCKEMKLSNNSSLFQSILAGFYNLPNFYKYSKIQQKLGRATLGSGAGVAGAAQQQLQSEIKYEDDDDEDPSTKRKPLPHMFNGIGVAPYSYELPFQLPDSNSELFNFHPIFICPVSKEQLIPITISEEMIADRKRKRIDRKSLSPNLSDSVSVANLDYISKNSDADSMYDNRIVDSQITLSSRASQVVVLKFCQHLALRDSVLQLSKKGTEIFKCHYCYKKHKLTDVSDAFFIDI
ncbi:hypothetical protein CLIB1423_30S00188 [[Candida] railenensis]|uniref:CTLH/CRA C-terminal to LisH motif domain-containing protein n=1 Tax=[Candida] railenensis TaxID=45579 RepID=A0A9P0W002_9ASCO|nr:hypothetical protein CLIB1423_30S00188 [[Candida] railenensis]